MPSQHIVLAGDSIFDNGGYVPGEPCVTDQLKTVVPNDWDVSRAAVDGDCIRHVRSRVSKMPKSTTYVVLSIGGNDVLSYANLLKKLAEGVSLESILEVPLREFEQQYADLLDWMVSFEIPLSVCTIYTAIPFVDELSRTFAPMAIDCFNKVILKSAMVRNVPVIRLDTICTDPKDFSAMSPIEPSAIGGKKIVNAIYQYVLEAVSSSH